MNGVHIYVSNRQPLTRYTVDVSNEVEPFEVTHHPDELFTCENCWRKRPASELVVQVYYDCHVITCREKEFGRSPEFPFEYTRVCIGTTFKPKHQRQSA